MESALKRFTDYVRYCYFHYTVITTVAMMEPIERYIFNAVFVVFFALFVYTTIIFLPGHLVMMLHFLLKAWDLPLLSGGAEEEEAEGDAEGMRS
ncbi:serine palmitoyltransferase small subunit A-like [Babylonia areolata]|uniref:serine palmitoyltransferase small subunit A-like n=1 Tax=Babylonia areolata TaxID=304850 RepID=UPI003FD532F6